MSATNNMEKWIGDKIFGTSDSSGIASGGPVGTIYLALHTATPEADGASECTGTSYARVDVSIMAGPSSANYFSYDSSNNRYDNDYAITFATAGSGGWGTATHAAIWDASTSGNCICWVALGSSQAIATNQQVSFAAAALQFTID
jgi:hypothetical protein